VASQTLRPLSIGEILDAGIKVLTRHWKVLTVCVVGLVGPLNVLQVLVQASIDPDAFKSGGSTTDTGAAIAGLLISLVVLGLGFLVAFTACFKAVADAWLGAPPAVGRSLRFGLRRLAPVLLIWILWVIVVTIGTVLFIIPGVYLAVVLCLSLPVLLFEGGGPFHAFGRSRSLVKGRFWPTFGLLLVGYLLVSIIGAIVRALLVGVADASSSSVLPEAIASVIGATVSNAITTPYLAAVLTILYFDMRVRKEGFDLQLLAEELGAPHDPDAPLPAPLVGEDITPEQRAAAPYWPPPPGWKPPPVGGEPAHAGWDLPSPDAGEEDRPRPAAEPARDPQRADWLPPEAPRGPGGL
jgi:hypothetical protein